MPQRKSNMVCPDWAKRELYGEPYVTRQEVCEYLGISISTLMKLKKSSRDFVKVNFPTIFIVHPVRRMAWLKLFHLTRMI